MTESADVHGIRDAAPRAVRDARLAWTLGGSLLIAHVVLIFVFGTMQPLLFAGSHYVGDALWAGALVIFAIGIRGSGSVVARRPMGIVALLVAAVMPFVLAIASTALTPASIDAGYDPTLSITIIQSLQALWLASLVVACVVIARAGAVPRRWRWLPLIALAVGVVPQIALAIATVSMVDAFSQLGFALAMQGVASLGTVAILALGVFAIVLAQRDAPRSADPVQVYPPRS